MRPRNKVIINSISLSLDLVNFLNGEIIHTEKADSYSSAIEYVLKDYMRLQEVVGKLARIQQEEEAQEIKLRENLKSYPRVIPQ